MLLDAGLTLAKGVLYEACSVGMSADEIYNRLESEKGNSSQEQDGDAGGKAGTRRASEELAPGNEDPNVPQVPADGRQYQSGARCCERMRTAPQLKSRWRITGFSHRRWSS